ncbi:MAG: tRNA(Ile)(2)-agmatinylcytidine synthase [Candidatus Thermoplasmatota archaeon]|nr:tRNA(Ile)(2)-agmatinylcytidine synthase [Candidatus Thermoplasmatota archaeon]
MTVYVGLDDTDSPRAMCTTFVATELIARFRTLGWSLEGYPRLVRLNPNIPWKTRGNGALCLRFGQGEASSRPAGAFRGWTARLHNSDGTAVPGQALFRAAQETVLRLADLDDPGTQPGLVVTRWRPGERLYWKAVRGVVSLTEIAADLERVDFSFAPKGSRGLIGALAALAWRPRDRTFEVIAYRDPGRWGTPRRLVPPDVAGLEERFPRTFNNFDRESGHMAIAPRSPCPVLFGIRGEGPEELPAALATVRGELLDRWLLFETNQGTDDHLVPRRVDDLPTHTSAILEGRVREPPRTLPGGHVVFSLSDGAIVDCVAYEPSKSFRRVVRCLLPGDRVRVYGAVRAHPRAINLEKLEVMDAAPGAIKRGNPRCLACGKSMKSAGRGAGYRCRRCGTRAAPAEARFVRAHRDLVRGVYEPPVSARRHLSKPLKRMAGPHEAFETTRMESAKMSIPTSNKSSSIVSAGM